jgi:predicted DNA-binding transcriptional regulator AlpA
MTAREAAALCGVSRRTVYRWLAEGRLTWPIVLDLDNLPQPRPRGPRRNRYSVRYNSGRHSFYEGRKPQKPQEGWES